jgi:hypothetical protein
MTAEKIRCLEGIGFAWIKRRHGFERLVRWNISLVKTLLLLCWQWSCLTARRRSGLGDELLWLEEDWGWYDQVQYPSLEDVILLYHQ